MEMTTKEAADYLTERGFTVRSHRQKGVSSAPTAHTLKQWCADGKIKGARKEGSKYRGEWSIPQEALDALLAPGSAGKNKKETKMKTFSYTAVSEDRISSTDLLAEQTSGAFGDFYRITIYNEDGSQAPEHADALYVPSEGRLGIAWGADATWADVKDVESGIEMWLNDGEAWEAAH